MRAGSFWAGVTTLVILIVPVLAGLGLLAFDAVYQSGNYVALMGYGLLALGSLLGYRAIKAKAGPAGLEVEARDTADLERKIRSRPGAAERIDAHAGGMRRGGRDAPV